MAHVADVVIIKNNKVLLVQQLKDSAKGLWSYPGGKIEKGETAEQAVVREVQEELDVSLIVYKHIKEYKIVTSFGPLTITTFTGKIGNQSININEDELLAYGWFSLKEVKQIADSLRGNIVLEQAKDVLAKTAEQV